MPVVKAEQRAHGPFLREPIHSGSGQQASPILQIQTPSLVLLPSLPQPYPRFVVCPFVARAVYLDVYSTVYTTEAGLLALPSLLYCYTPRALCLVTWTFYYSLSDAFSTPPRRTRMTSATASYDVLVAVSRRAGHGGNG